MTYNFSAFKYVIRAPEEEAWEIASLLMRSRPGVPNGSSFAVTSDAPRGRRCIHLSEASYKTLHDLHIIPGLYPIDPPEQERT